MMTVVSNRKRSVLGIVKKLFRFSSNVATDFTMSCRRCDGIRCALRLWWDLTYIRIRNRLGVSSSNRERRIAFKDGARICYRLNIGDMTTIREVYLQEFYKASLGTTSIGCFVDIGSNIGLASIWIKRRYNCERMIAVEPLPANVALARRNFAANNVEIELIEAAAGIQDGFTGFVAHEAFNGGHVGEGTLRVRMVSMDSLTHGIDTTQGPTLFKIDVEGAEMDLLKSNSSWIDRVDALMIEFHSGVERQFAIELLKSKGLSLLARDEENQCNVDVFLRQSCP